MSTVVNNARDLKAFLMGLIQPPKIPFWRTMTKNSGGGSMKFGKYERHQGVRERERRLRNAGND